MPKPVLVVIFLRGGADGLNLICPSGDNDFIAARASGLRVDRKGDDAGHLLRDQAADVDFRFHAQARPLWELFDVGELAVIHASGLTDGTRSHFDAEDRMERAAPASNAGGWLARWLAEARPEGDLPALAIGDSTPESLRGASGVPVAAELSELLLPADHDLAHFISHAMQDGFAGHPLIGPEVERLVGLSNLLSTKLINPRTNEPIAHQTDQPYPDGQLGRSLMTMAQAIKLDLGTRVATVDFGGWDTHINQKDDFAAQVDQLSRSIMAFWRDLGAHRDRTTVIVMSEFGRRLRNNTAGGTDHGFGNAMMVLGGAISGGRMLGRWPGLGNTALDMGADLAITTDYRSVLSEVVLTQMGTADLSNIFPGFDPTPLGLFG